MKKGICLLLAFVFLMASVWVTASAEEAQAKQFVVDGVLDEWYRDDQWAVENNYYFYFNGLDDTLLDVISKEPGAGNGVQDLLEFNEDVTVKIHVANDDQYAYFFVDVDDSDIAQGVANSEGSVNLYSQYCENIDFYIDTDTYSAGNGSFTENLSSPSDSEAHFRLIAHNMAITDLPVAVEKDIFANQTDKTMNEYFKNTDNVVSFQKTDENGKLIGYGCEMRFPLAYTLGEDYAIYTDMYFNIAVTNHATEADPTCCAITTGKRWWLAYDTGKTVALYFGESNPFFNQPDPDKEAAAAVDALITALPEPDALSLTQDKANVEAARAAYDGLTEAQKLLVEHLATLIAAEDKIKALEQWEPGYEKGDVTMDQTVDAGDALQVLRAAVGKISLSPREFAFGDMNEDGVLDAVDALAILKKAVGK